MDIIENPEIFLEFALPLAGATVLIIAIESLYHKLEKGRNKRD